MLKNILKNVADFIRIAGSFLIVFFMTNNGSEGRYVFEFVDVPLGCPEYFQWIGGLSGGLGAAMAIWTEKWKRPMVRAFLAFAAAAICLLLYNLVLNGPSISGQCWTLNCGFLGLIFLYVVAALASGYAAKMCMGKSNKS